MTLGRKFLLWKIGTHSWQSSDGKLLQILEAHAISLSQKKKKNGWVWLWRASLPFCSCVYCNHYPSFLFLHPHAYASSSQPAYASSSQPISPKGKGVHNHNHYGHGPRLKQHGTRPWRSHCPQLSEAPLLPGQAPEGRLNPFLLFNMLGWLQRHWNVEDVTWLCSYLSFQVCWSLVTNASFVSDMSELTGPNTSCNSSCWDSSLGGSTRLTRWTKGWDFNIEIILVCLCRYQKLCIEIHEVLTFMDELSL